jgi:hypothetical protein
MAAVQTIGGKVGAGNAEMALSICLHWSPANSIEAIQKADAV